MPPSRFPSPAAIARAALPALCVALAACNAAPEPGEQTDADPAMMAALEEPLMTDPDLSQANARNLVADPGGPGDMALPALGFAPEEARQARARAQALAGADGRLDLPGFLPRPSPRLAAAKQDDLAVRARMLVDGGGCAEPMERGFGLARALPAAFPIYPAAHLVEAARAGAEGCALMAASFTSPVPPQPLMAFYHARARAAGYDDAASVEGDAALLEGARGTARFAVLLRNAGGGVTAIDLVVRAK